MDLRQLRYFVVLSEELHFRKAAERLNITQAPLSVAIQSLERELGGQLFHRTQRKVAITDLGTAFRGHALAVLDRLESGLQDARHMVAGEVGRLRIAFTSASSLLSFFPEIIRDFRAGYPNVQIALRDLSSKRQIEALRNREIDIGLTRSRHTEHHSDITYTRLLSDPLVVVMHRAAALAERDSLWVADLRDQPLIFYPPHSGIGIQDLIVQLCAAHGFAPSIIQEAMEATTIVGLAAAGLGIAVVPSELQCIQVPNVVFRPLNDLDARTDLLLAHRAGERNVLVSRFRHMAMAILERTRAGLPGAVGI